MPFRNSVAALLLLVLSAPTAGQEIEPGKEGELATLLAPVSGAHICWRRIYSRDHLAKHPAQTVTDIEFRLAYQTYGPDKDFPEMLHSYMFQLLARRRGETKRLQNVGNCMIRDDGRVFCGIDCDGGGVYLRHRDGNRKLLVGFDEMWGIALTDCGGETEEADEPEAVPLVPGKDDKSFLLDRVDDAECPAFDDWLPPSN